MRILESGAAFCWDAEGQHPGELPASEVASITGGWTFSCALDQDGAPYCWSGPTDDFPQTPTRV